MLGGLHMFDIFRLLLFDMNVKQLQNNSDSTKILNKGRFRLLTFKCYLSKTKPNNIALQLYEKTQL